MTDETALWSILCCRSDETETLNGELAELGAWAPMFPLRFRRPKMRSPRVVMRPLLPGFVFLPTQSLSEAQSRRIHRDCCSFYVFKFNNISSIAWKELQPLKEFETMAQLPKRRASPPSRPFCLGEMAQIKAGPFAGMPAEVVDAGLDYCTVEINRLKIRVATSLLDRFQARAEAHLGRGVVAS